MRKSHGATGGQVYFRDRRTLKFTRSYSGDRQVVFQSALPLTNVKCRQRLSPIKAEIRRISSATADLSESTSPSDARAVYQFHYDLSMVRADELVELEMETVARMSGLGSQLPFLVDVKTEWLTV